MRGIIISVDRARITTEPTGMGSIFHQMGTFPMNQVVFGGIIEVDLQVESVWGATNSNLFVVIDVYRGIGNNSDHEEQIRHTTTFRPGENANPFIVHVPWQWHSSESINRVSVTFVADSSDMYVTGTVRSLGLYR